MLDTVPFQVGQWSLHAISGMGWAIWLMGGGSSCDKADSGRFGILPSAFDGRYSINGANMVEHGVRFVPGHF